MQLRKNGTAAYAAQRAIQGVQFTSCNPQQIQHVRNNSVNARLHAPRLMPALTCLAAASLVSRAAQGNAALT